MLANVPGIERRRFTEEDLARIDEIEKIVIQAMREIEAEEAEAKTARASSG